MRTLFSGLLVAVAAAIVSTPVNATPLSFEISGGSLGCFYGGGCAEFAADTGLPPPGTFDTLAHYTVDFTLDMSAAALTPPPNTPLWYSMFPIVGQTYLMSGPAARLRIDLGDLTLDFQEFYFSIASLDLGGSAGMVDAINLFLPFSTTDPTFSFSFMSHSSYFDDYTPQELAHTPLGGFTGVGSDGSAVGAFVRYPGHFTVTGNGGGIQRVTSVPEPTPLYLFAAALLTLCAGRRRVTRAKL